MPDDAKDIDAAVDAGWRLRGYLQELQQLAQFAGVDWYYASRYQAGRVSSDVERQAALSAIDRIRHVQQVTQNYAEAARNVAAPYPDSRACTGYLRMIEGWVKTVAERASEDGIRAEGQRMGWHPLRMESP